MDLFGYEFRFSSTAKRSLNDLKVFKRRNYTHIVWYRFSVIFGEYNFCEECGIRADLGQELCDECHEHLICECGNRLEDSYGSPGDGFCIMCR